MPFTLPNRPPKTTPADPTCGQCGYCVRGISTLTCPECGSDLREVGIIPPNKRIFGSKTIKLILWTFAAPPLAALISILLLFTVLPFAQMYKVDRSIQIQLPNLTTTISIWGEQRSWRPPLLGRPTISPESFTVWDQGTLIFLEIKPSTGEFAYQTRGTFQSKHGANLTGKVVADCFMPPKASLADPQLSDLFDALCATIIDTSKRINTNKVIPLLDRNGIQIGVAQPMVAWVVHDEPSPILIAALAVFWLIIWIYGYRRILR
jgi:hypothetical protein